MSVSSRVDGSYHKLKKSLHGEFINRFQSKTQLKQVIKSTFACILAIALAVLLKLDAPFWSAISAFVVIQGSLGSTLAKSLLRFLGTVIGAGLGVVLAGLFIQYTFVYYSVIFSVAVVGIYCSSVDRQHAYAWLLGYITMLMVMLNVLSDPSPNAMYAVAVYRSLEIAIGIFASFVTCLLFPTGSSALLLNQAITGFIDNLQEVNHYFYNADGKKE
ncbi:FUSC family protein [Piscirickettsia litoralis]|uniref:FUSC family protein n=1 Tax=Piscirickettsia litoralis TaxID=1891921 RepID=A0ABX2ZY41_9GAMM|nr:FUSC family protein [Piscirickettsia litoralis]ODN41492.1 hypothetical protein BGC07_15370 [Piscirickettsia litoralis]